MKKINNLENSTILITGGNGAVGCNLVRRLLVSNANVVVLDDFSQSDHGNLTKNKKLTLIKGNINNKSTLKKTFAKQYDFVFHLAARFANEMSVDNPIEDLRVNIEGTLNILLHVSKQNVSRFLYTSSSSLYGPQMTKKFHEKLYPNPSTPYAASKLSGEFYCNAIHELYGIDYTIVRLSNSYGPFDPPGKFRNVIPNFFHNAINGKNLIITGTGYETRDFTYVDDTIDGLMLAMFSKKGKNELFNLGTGIETKIKDVAQEILDVTGSKSKIIYKPRRFFDHIKNRKMDISKAKKLLSYNPKINFKMGIQKTSNWLLSR